MLPDVDDTFERGLNEDSFQFIQSPNPNFEFDEKEHDTRFDISNIKNYDDDDDFQTNKFQTEKKV